MPLEVDIKYIVPDIAVVTLKGSLTLGTSLKIADSQIQAPILNGFSKLVLDMTAVSYVDSAGLGVIVHAYGLTHERKGALRLCGVQERVAAMLKMTRTDLFLSIDSDVAASLAAIG